MSEKKTSPTWSDFMTDMKTRVKQINDKTNENMDHVINSLNMRSIAKILVNSLKNDIIIFDF